MSGTPTAAAPHPPEPPAEGSLRGLVVRAAVVSLGVLAGGVMVVDWNELAAWLPRQTTIDANLRGDARQISARVAGYVRRVAVADYAEVRAGELLYEIEPQDYAAAVDGAAAAVTAAEAAVRVAAAQVVQQGRQIDVARHQIEQTDADLTKARLEADRQSRLQNTPAFLVRDWEQAVATARQLEATIAGNRADLAAQTAQLAVLQADVEQARAQLSAQRAALQSAEVNLAYTRVTAPADGRVAQSAVREGQYVTVGALLTQFAPLDDIWVVANFRETQLTNMRVGQPATVAVDTFPGVTLAGRVDSLEPGSQAVASLLPPARATGNFTKIVQRVPVKIRLDPGHPLAGRLLPGMSAEATVRTDAPP